MVDEKNDSLEKRESYFELSEELPTRDDMKELFEKLSNMAGGINDKKKKMSYSISQSTQIFVKNLSEKSGATQGNIVDLAPFFFASVIEKSLKRRNDRLTILEESVRKITGTLSGLSLNAPHLSGYIDHVSQMIDDILNMEKEAIEKNNFNGVDPENFKSLSAIKKNKEKPAYFREIEKFLEKGSETETLFRKIFGDN